MNDNQFEEINCNLCKTDKYEVILTGRDYRFGGSEQYNFVKCTNCGLLYLNPRPTAEAILQLYKKKYTPGNTNDIIFHIDNNKYKAGMRKIWHTFTGNYFDEIVKKSNGKILDIGCNNGYLLLMLKAVGKDGQGIETNPKSVEICKKSELNVFGGTLEDSQFKENCFDTIILSQVLEHVPSPKETLKEVHRILKPNGKVLIYCPNVKSYLKIIFNKYWHGWHIPFHFYGFSDNSIRLLAKKCNFDIVKIATKTPENFLCVSLKSYIENQLHSLILVKKNLIRITDTIFFRLTISIILRILDICFKGKGDCLKIELIRRNI